MKRNLLLIVAYVTSGYVFGQSVETVSMGAGYANENYYTLNNGNEVSVDRSNWDLAFASDGLGGSSSTIRINGGIGTQCWLYSNNINEWSALDTTAFAWTANQLVNADASWSVGAFENKTPSNDFDLGWGTYNMITHAVVGDRIFILKLANGEYKKLVINSLISGVFSFRYANLDGSSSINASFTKSNYSGKNFGYYSIQNGAALDREPVSASWDLLFTKYQRGSDGYVVSGVLSNIDAKVAKAYPVNNVNTASHIGENYTSIISTIGYDWKSFNMSTFQYDIEDSLVYFVEVPNQDIYRVIFTGFGGSSTGEFIFTKELVGSTVSVGDNIITNQILNVYPNPATSVINLTFVGNENTQIGLFDVTGNIVFFKNSSDLGLNQEAIDVSSLMKGMYFLTLTSENNKSTQKIIIQ